MFIPFYPQEYYGVLTVIS